MALKYKVGDKVRIKSLDWYNENKDDYGYVWCTDFLFTPEHSKYCGRELTISHVTEFEIPSYVMESSGHDWTAEMIECKVEEETRNNNDVKEKETLLGWIKESDNLRLVPHKDYEIKHDGDNFYLVKKKKKYPKTYEECCEVLDFCGDYFLTTYEADCIPKKEVYGILQQVNSLTRLLICKSAYWKIAGEEMGLGKPWEPDWNIRGYYAIARSYGNVVKTSNYNCDLTFVFPTEEMRDAFYENFKSKIEFCKELL